MKVHLCVCVQGGVVCATLPPFSLQCSSFSGAASAGAIPQHRHEWTSWRLEPKTGRNFIWGKWTIALIHVSSLSKWSGSVLLTCDFRLYCRVVVSETTSCFCCGSIQSDPMETAYVRLLYLQSTWPVVLG